VLKELEKGLPDDLEVWWPIVARPVNAIREQPAKMAVDTV